MVRTQMITSACFLFIALAAIKAIFNDDFKDSLIQRVGLSLVALFGLGMAYNVHNFGASPVLTMYAVGQTIFTLGSMVKRT